MRLTFRLLTLSTLLFISACAEGPDRKLQLASQGLLSGELSADGTLAVIGSVHHGGSLWDLQQDARLFDWNHQSGTYSAIRASSISGDKQSAVTCVDDNMVLWNTQSGEAMKFWRAPDRILSIKLNSNGKRALMGLRNGTVLYFNMENGAAIHSFAHAAEVRQVDISANDSIGISGSDDKTTKIYDLSSGKELHSIVLENQIKTVAVSPSGALAFTTAQREDSMVLNTSTGKPIFALSNRYTNYTSASFSDDESYLAVGTFQGEIKQWHIKTATESHSWQASPRKEYGSSSSKAIVDLSLANNTITALTSDGMMQTFKQP